VAVETYGVTTASIDALVIWAVAASTDPTTVQMDEWIKVGAAELHAGIGDLTGACNTEEFRARAAHVVALYAAAMAEDAHYPERAGKPGTYGTRLWDRWKEQSDRLAVDVEACRDSTAAGSDRGGAAHSFPSGSMFTQTIGF
jgi:hypothetical protein